MTILLVVHQNNRFRCEKMKYYLQLKLTLGLIYVIAAHRFVQQLTISLPNNNNKQQILTAFTNLWVESTIQFNMLVPSNIYDSVHKTITYILRQISEDMNQFHWKKFPNKEKEIECQTNQTVF